MLSEQTRRVSYATIVSILFVNLNHINAQTGAGCFSSTCWTPGQIRMDAIIENGQFVGGCNCACPPSLYDTTSLQYCHGTVNFDSRTLLGDCGCTCDPSITPDCIFPTTFDSDTCGCSCPVWAPHPDSCLAPQQFVPELCQCACPNLGSVGGPCAVRGQFLMGSMVRPDCTCDRTAMIQCHGNQEMNPITGECHCPAQSASGAWYPQCESPLVKDPVSCDCVRDPSITVAQPVTPVTPVQPVQPVTQTTTTAQPVPLPIAPSPVGQTNPPTFGKTTSPPIILTPIPTLPTASPTLPTKAPTLPTPEPTTTTTATPTTAAPTTPPPTIPIPPVAVECTAAGDCGCPPGTQADCKITCDGNTHSCTDGTIRCNNDGFDCAVNCMAGASCSGSSVIYGPAEGTLTVRCMGGRACSGVTVVDHTQGVDTTIVCGGSQSCTDSVQFNFGRGYSRVACIGNPDSCQGVVFNLPANAQSLSGAAFLCTGVFCPGSAPAPFSNIMVNAALVRASAPSSPPSSGSSPWSPYTQSSPSAGTGIIPLNPRSANINTNPLTAKATGTAPGAAVGGSVIGAGAPNAVVVPNEIVVCEGLSCQCSNTKPCIIQCVAPDACKDAVLACPPDHDCTLICAETGCDKVELTGPVGHHLTVQCNGDSSCMNANFMATEAVDVSYTCGGIDACKGAATFLNCGLGDCNIQCTGEVACDAAVITPGVTLSFVCFGASAPCPPNYTSAPVPPPTPFPTVPCAGLPPCPCSYQQCFEERDPVTCGCTCPFEILLKSFQGDPTICGTSYSPLKYLDQACACDCPAGSQPDGGCPGGQVFNGETCQCECPSYVTCTGTSTLNALTCQCECPTWTPRENDCLALNKVLRDCQCACPIPCPGPGQIQSSGSCRCGCPFGTPDPSQCSSGFIDELYCQCAAPIPSTYCCQTSEPNFLPWAGRCWGQTSMAACNAVDAGRCVWEPNNCHSDPPVNTLDFTKGCSMRDEPCAIDADCCSEVCRVNGFCR